MNGWTTTKVFDIDGHLVVADSIEEAIELFRIYVDNGFDPRSVSSVKSCTGDYGAIIKEE